MKLYIWKAGMSTTNYPGDNLWFFDHIDMIRVDRGPAKMFDVPIEPLPTREFETYYVRI